jgi:hypothetical protein
MSGFRVKFNFDKNRVAASIQANCDKGIAIISNEALEDANHFARFDQGELIKSSIRASQPEKGRLVWDTPYAKRMYYTGHPVTYRPPGEKGGSNPYASLMWAHKGASANKDKYLRMLKKLREERIRGTL